MSSLRDDQGLRQPPEVNLHLDVRFHSVPMKLALVAPDGTQTRAMKGARLMPGEAP